MNNRSHGQLEISLHVTNSTMSIARRYAPIAGSFSQTCKKFGKRALLYRNTLRVEKRHGPGPQKAPLAPRQHFPI